jgi:hypothetical protein
MYAQTKKSKEPAMTTTMKLIKVQYHFGRAMARLAVPLMRATGFRFSKAWRGNPIINHVEANLMADGFDVPAIKFN